MNLTDAMRAARERALALVGDGYIYGAKGQTCTPSFRRRQAAQYPDQASNILGTGAKWDGRPVWDCAQLTRTVAAAAGVTLVSGATSQWMKTAWARKGEITGLPEGEPVFLYRRQAGSDTTMAHTGVALGDGTCVHARGTAYGVVRQGMNEYAWTHWASPWPAETDTEGGERMSLTDRTCTVVGGRLALRPEASAGSGLMFWMPEGTRVLVLEDAGGWCRVRYDRDGVSYMGWCMSRYLETVSDDEEAEDGSEETVTVTLKREVALALLEALDAATARG